MDDHAGTGQVQSGVAGLQGNQEGRRIVRIELVDEFETLLLGRGAGDGVVAQALRVETFGDQIKEAGELGEDQRLLAFVHTGFHQFGDGGKLGRLILGIGVQQLGSQQIWRNLVNSARMRIFDVLKSASSLCSSCILSRCS